MVLDSKTVVVEIKAGQIDGKAELFVNVALKPSINIDRLFVHGWGLGAPSSRTWKLAERLQKAVLAGKAFGPASAKVDIHGASYISGPALIMGRYLNADLKKAGF
jgi:hypothetical protein